MFSSLERAEVLAGFAMAVLLLFMGFDVVSHTAEHLVEGYYESPTNGDHGTAEVHTHEAHIHHTRISPGSVDLASLAALISTVISGLLLKNHARIGKGASARSTSAGEKKANGTAQTAMSFAPLSIPLLSNPSHLLTVAASLFLLLIPLTSTHFSAILDRALALSMALCMILIGVRLVKSLGSMLLMSSRGPGVAYVVQEIEKDVAVTGVEDARFWQVHHGLGMASVRLGVVGSVQGEGEGRVRERIARLVRDRLGGVYGGGGKGIRWEVSVALSTAVA